MVYLKLALLLAVFAYCKYSVTCGTCKDRKGWYYSEKADRCWMYIGGEVGAISANRLCYIRLGVLARPTSSVIQEELVKFRNEKFNHHGVAKGAKAWIGLNDLGNEGTFTWTGGKPLNYTNWKSGEPNNHGGDEHCVYLNPEGKWMDQECEARFHILCEFDETALKQCTKKDKLCQYWTVKGRCTQEESKKFMAENCSCFC